jgi:hypothetical protein
VAKELDTAVIRISKVATMTFIPTFLLILLILPD